MAFEGQKQIALMIAGFKAAGRDISAEAEEALLTLITLAAMDATATDPDGALVADPEHLGYLKREIDGKTVHIPFNLAKVSPNADILSEVMDIGNLIQLDVANPICISGSTTFLGALNIVADLDYCEYFFLPNAKTGQAIEGASRLAELPLISAKFSDEKFYAPWDCLSPIAIAFCEAHDRLKLDFISCGKLGPMPTTNVIVPIVDGIGDCETHSFAYQEAVVSSDKPPRILVRPSEFADYLLFLMEQAREYIAESETNGTYAIKALKRLLALRVALGEYKEVDEIISRLNRPEIEEVVQRIRLNELLEMQPFLPGGTPARFARQIAELQENSALATPEDEEETLAAARELAVTLLDETERDFAEYA